MTDIVLNQHVPGGVMKQLGDAAGGIVYGQYTPGGCMGQLHAASGLGEPFDQYTPGGSCGQIEQELEGGSGAPAWVPADAVIHIDFLGGTPQGRAWTATGGEVGIETLLGTDANTIAGLSPSLYSSANLTADGYLIPDSPNDDPPALIGAARNLVTGAGGFTIRVAFKQVLVGAGGGEDSSPLVLMSADGNDAIEVDFVKDASQSLRGSSWGGSLSVSSPDCMNIGVGASNVAAFTLIGSRYEQAANGSVVATGTVDSTDRPPSNPLVAAVIYSIYAAIVSITIYDPLPDTTGLSELSEPA